MIALGFGLITPVLPGFAPRASVWAPRRARSSSARSPSSGSCSPPSAAGSSPGWASRPIYLLGLVIVAVSTGATAFAQWYLAAARLPWPRRYRVGDVHRGGRGAARAPRTALHPGSGVLRLHTSAFLIGGIGGPVFGGVLGNLGLRVPFLVYAVALLIAAALVAALLRGASLRPPEGSPVLPAMTARDGWRDSAYRASVVSGFANGWAKFGVRNAILPLFAVFAIVNEPWVAGMALAVFAVGNAIGLTFAGRYSDRVGRRPFIISGLVVSGIATAVTGFASNLPVLVVLSVIAGIGAGT